MTEAAFPVPDGFARTMIEVFAAEGEAWLRRLPLILVDCERR